MDLNQAALELMEETSKEAPISVEKLDLHLKELRELRDQADMQKSFLTELNKRVAEKERELLNILDSLDRKSYSLPDIGIATRVIDKSFKMPEEPSKREQLFKYINDNYGKDVLYKYTTIHHQALNSFVKTEIETKNEIPPGLDTPTPTEYLKFTRR